MNTEKIIYKELSYKIIGILFEVYNNLGYGHKEKYYENAIAENLRINQIKFEEQKPHKLLFKNKEVGRYYLDFVIDDKIVLEIKKGQYFAKGNIEQIKSYLKITGLKLAILANFTPSGIKFFRLLNINQ